MTKKRDTEKPDNLERVLADAAKRTVEQRPELATEAGMTAYLQASGALFTTDLDILTAMVRRAGYPAGALTPAGPGAPEGARMTLLVFDRDDTAMQNGAAWWAHFRENGSLLSLKTLPLDAVDAVDDDVQ